MPNYIILVNGQSRTKQQLMDLFAMQDYPNRLSITGLVNENNPVSQQWSFEKSPNNEGYTFSQQQVVLHGLPAVFAQQYVEMEDFVEYVTECINSFGPDAVAVNAPPEVVPQLPNNNDAADAANQQHGPNPFGPVNENENENMQIGQAGGANKLTVYYVGLVPNSIMYSDKERYAPAAVPLLPIYGDLNAVGEFYSKKVFKYEPGKGFVGYPDEPIGEWKMGWPGMNFGNENVEVSENGAPPGFSAAKKGGRRFVAHSAKQNSRRKATRRRSTRRRKASRRGKK